jgi:hypothetical protein
MAHETRAIGWTDHVSRATAAYELDQPTTTWPVILGCSEQKYR